MSKQTVKKALATVVGAGLRYRDTTYISNLQGRYVKDRDERAIIDAVLEYVNALDNASKKKPAKRRAPTKQCDEKDLSTLLYLTESIVRYPRDIDVVFNAVAQWPRMGIKLSQPLDKNICTLQIALKGCPRTDTAQRRFLTKVANDLVKEKHSADAGHALRVALEQNPPSG